MLLLTIERLYAKLVLCNVDAYAHQIGVSACRVGAEAVGKRWLDIHDSNALLSWKRLPAAFPTCTPNALLPLISDSMERVEMGALSA